MGNETLVIDANSIASKTAHIDEDLGVSHYIVMTDDTNINIFDPVLNSGIVTFSHGLNKPSYVAVDSKKHYIFIAATNATNNNSEVWKFTFDYNNTLHINPLAFNVDENAGVNVNVN